MGTHPIFESDFDCLTEGMTSTETQLGPNRQHVAESMDIRARKEVMKNMYSPQKRATEVVSITVATGLILLDLIFYFGFFKINGLLTWITVATSLFLGILAADFFSGFVHWAADTWFTVDLPIFGPSIIRSFREHHIDPMAILNHDFIETNADTFMLTIPFTLVNCYSFLTGAKVQDDLFFDTFLLSLCVFVSLTNEFHKISHDYRGHYGKWVKPLQSAWLILPQSHHRIHHIRPHSTYYCITTGWLDRPLEAIDFWRRLERLITQLTGAVPRADDHKWTQLTQK